VNRGAFASRWRALPTALVVVSISAAPIADGASGLGDQRAAEIAAKSPLVTSSVNILVSRAREIRDSAIRDATLDALENAQTCLRHRAGLGERQKESILQTLSAAGLMDSKTRQSFPGGWVAGVFPPVLDDGTACPHLPQPFFAAPGGVFGKHHSFPGGLAVHEANNQTAALNLLNEYTRMYGIPKSGPPVAENGADPRATVAIDPDWLLAAPVWHDWAKTIVFQWNVDGSEFPEMQIGGNGLTDNYGSRGDSRTGAHHILSLAEAMSRRLPSGLIITQACAHSSPTEGAEYKVVNWLRTAAIIARVDPVGEGYLVMDSIGHFRLPPLRKLGSVNLIAVGEVNMLPEYVLHNLSDADHPFSMAAAAATEIILKELAPEFGFHASDLTKYNLEFRNPVLSFFSADRLYIVYSSSGREGVKKELEKAHQQAVF